MDELGGGMRIMCAVAHVMPGPCRSAAPDVARYRELATSLDGSCPQGAYGSLTERRLDAWAQKFSVYSKYKYQVPVSNTLIQADAAMSGCAGV